MNKRKLRARWSKKENDILYSYPRRPDGHYLYHIFDKKNKRGTFGYDLPPLSFLEDLEARGYDLTTLKFEIELKPNVK